MSEKEKAEQMLADVESWLADVLDAHEDADAMRMARLVNRGTLLTQQVNLRAARESLFPD